MHSYNYLPPISLYIFWRFIFNVSWDLFNYLVIIISNYEWLFIVFIEMLVYELDIFNIDYYVRLPKLTEKKEEEIFSFVLKLCMFNFLLLRQIKFQMENGLQHLEF